MAGLTGDSIMFDRAGDSPAAWLFLAYQLRNAAAKVDWLAQSNIPVSTYESPNCYELDRRLTLLPWRHNPDLMNIFPVYRLLMGLSFENLLKGILIAQGVSATTAGKLKQDFRSHNLRNLLGKVAKSSLIFTSEDHKLLEEIGRFVEWQGRYPIPTADTGYTGMYVANNPDEHKLEHELWDRLRNYLVEVGWHKDVEGTCYKLKLEGARVSIGEPIQCTK